MEHGSPEPYLISLRETCARESVSLAFVLVRLVSDQDSIFSAKLICVLFIFGRFIAVEDTEGLFNIVLLEDVDGRLYALEAGFLVAAGPGRPEDTH